MANMIDRYMQDPEWARLFVGEGAANEIAETIAIIMRDEGLSVANVAQRANLDERSVKTILRGGGRTVQHIAEILHAVGYRLVIKVEKQT